jgi:hypothetical protein
VGRTLMGYAGLSTGVRRRTAKPLASRVPSGSGHLLALTIQLVQAPFPRTGQGLAKPSEGER